MVLKDLELKNFRLHKNTNLEFSDSLNFIVGGNAQGKTSILEAVYFLCTSKSFLTSQDSEAINNDSKLGFEINGLFENIVQDNVQIVFDSSINKKLLFLNRKQIGKASELIGRFPVVILTQSDYAISQGSPAERRRFFDGVLSQIGSNYLNILLDYQKTLKQRASLLALIKETQDKSLTSQLDVWSERLAKLGSEIIEARLVFIDNFNHYLIDTYRFIMAEDEIPQISYDSSFDFINGDFYNSFLTKLEQRRELEIVRAQNLYGPHRDDFVFSVNGLSLRQFGSQGQHKTFLVSLKFAQYFYYKEKIGRKAIFLLDDVFGELDSHRASKIADYLKEIGQAFITLTDFNNYGFLHKNSSDRLFKIEKGMSVKI